MSIGRDKPNPVVNLGPKLELELERDGVRAGWPARPFSLRPRFAPVATVPMPALKPALITVVV